MSITHYLSEREKYKHILQLSKEQAKALEANDMEAFQRILTAKGDLIGTLKDAQSVIAVDPSVTSMVQQIQNSEHFAERLLYRKLGRVRREIHKVTQKRRQSTFSDGGDSMAQSYSLPA